MHITLLYFVVILLSAGVYSISQDEPSDKEAIRAYTKKSLNRALDSNVEVGCATNLTAEQITYGQGKLNEFIDCLRITVDKLFDRLDDNITRDEFEELSFARTLIPHVCDLYDDTFKCVIHFEPMLNLCLEPDQIQMKDNGFIVASMIHDSVCVENGTVLADFATQPDAGRCSRLAVDEVGDLIEQLFRTDDILGSESDCEKLTQVQTQFLNNIRSCSDSEVMWNSAKRLIENFCSQTKCQKLVNNFKCFE